MAALDARLWRLYIFDLSSAEVIGELIDVRDLHLNFSLSKNPTMGFTTGYGHWLADEIVGSPTQDPYRGILAYRLNPISEEYDLQFAGPILATDEQANQSTEPLISVTATGAGWRLSKRIADNTSGAGRTEAGMSFASVDRAKLAAQLIRTTNTKDGNSWIRALDSDQQPGSLLKVDKEESFQPVAQLIDKLSGTLDGFDWHIEPDFTTDAAGLILGRFKSAPIIGTDKSASVVFDYGIGRFNTESVARKRSIESIMNKGSYPSAGQSPYAITAQADESIGKLGIFEETISGDLTDASLRRKMVQLHVALRRQARQLYEFVPFRSDTGNVPVPFVDYNIGDRVGARAAWAEKTRLEASMRIYGINISVDNAGAERVTLDLYIS